VYHDLDKLRRLYDVLQATGEYVLTRMWARGTEPTIHPQIRDILEMATQAGGIYLSTNLSIPVGQWAPDRPRRVYASASYHPSQVGLVDFLAALEAAREAGLVVVPQVVAHPSYLPIDDLRAAFAERGFAPVFRVFRGAWEGRTFPAQYSEEERAAFGLPVKPAPPPPNRDACIAGWRTVAVQQDTRLARCARQWDRPELAGLLPGPAPCLIRGDCPSLRSHDTRDFLPLIERVRAALERNDP